MIELKVEDYCQECPDFKADVDKSCQRYYDHRLHAITIVRCEWAERCKQICKRFSKIQERKVEQ